MKSAQAHADMESSPLWDRIRALEHANNQAAARISRLEASLTECLEYFEDKYDVNDGDYGEPSPNKEMQLGTMIKETLHGPGAF